MKIFSKSAQTAFGVILLVLLTITVAPQKTLADFNPSNLISDGSFIDINRMDTGAIQRFLEGKGGFLKDFSEGGRSAAQIIYDAAHGRYDAAGSINGITINESTGTVNPQVILVTLQKETSLVTRAQRDDNMLRLAMGYGCPDSGGCNPAYAGFTKQVENGAWQLRYNYERAEGHGFSTYQVGQDFCFDDWNGTHCGRFDNRATASLYRYTPHVYNGNYNFSFLFTSWFAQGEFSARADGQSSNVTARPGEIVDMSVRFKNTGTYTWYNHGANPVNLAVDKNTDEWFMARFNYNWLSTFRIAKLDQSVVPSGSVGTYHFKLYIPSDIRPGAYRFNARLVAEGIQWFEPEANGGAWWEIWIPPPSAQWDGQSPSVSAWPGQTVPMEVAFINKGGAAWRKNWPFSTNLALDRYKNENFLKQFMGPGWLSEYRVAALDKDIVYHEQRGVFRFNIRIPSYLQPGGYRFDVRMVTDGFSWFENPLENGAAWWWISVPRPQAQWAGQAEHPVAARGQTKELWIKFKNTSGTTWKKDGPVPVSLAIDKFWANETAWQGPGWISANRITKAEEGDIAPGQVGTFKFKISVPDSMPSGSHRFYVRLVADNYSWFEEPDTNGAAWWQIWVP